MYGAQVGQVVQTAEVDVERLVARAEQRVLLERLLARLGTLFLALEVADEVLASHVAETRAPRTPALTVLDVAEQQLAQFACACQPWQLAERVVGEDET